MGLPKLRQTFAAVSFIIDGDSRLRGYAFSIEQVDASEHKAGKHSFNQTAAKARDQCLEILKNQSECSPMFLQGDTSN